MATEPNEAAPAARSTLTQRIFVAALAIVFLLPLVALPWAKTESVSGQAPVEFPTLFDGSGAVPVNAGFLGELGAWFEDHFAYRGDLITLNAKLRAGVFRTSATDQVVIGSDGWLYYNGTLSDYVGAAPMSERALFNAAHNLALFQAYAEALGASFAFTIAPNKNSIYPDHMPARYLRSEEPSNAERLAPYLEALGVNYVDMFQVLRSEIATQATQEALYYRLDTHWTNRGAWVAYQGLAEATGLEVPELPAWTEARHSGDLEAMLYPTQTTATEADLAVPGINDGMDLAGSAWTAADGATCLDYQIETTGPGQGTVLVFRDSFGNALCPYIATATDAATFTQLVPYNGLLIGELGADAVIVERAERHLSYLSQEAPVVPSPALRLTLPAGSPAPATAAASTLERGENGPLTSFSGVVDPGLLTTDSLVYVAITGPDGVQTVYEAFTLTGAGGDNAYLAYVVTAALPASGEVTVHVSTNGTLTPVQSEAL
jgi:hypothetical protein